MIRAWPRANQHQRISRGSSPSFTCSPADPPGRLRQRPPRQRHLPTRAQGLMPDPARSAAGAASREGTHMPWFDLPLEDLREYRTAAVEPAGLDGWWSARLADARAAASPATLTRYRPDVYG